MAVSIERNFKWKPSGQLTLTSALGTTPDIPMEGFAGGTVYIKAGTAITSIAFWGASRSPGSADPTAPGTSNPTAPTYYALHDSSDAAVTQSVTAACCYNLPAQSFGFGSLKMVLTGVASETVEISMKG